MSSETPPPVDNTSPEGEHISPVPPKIPPPKLRRPVKFVGPGFVEHNRQTEQSALSPEEVEATHPEDTQLNFEDEA